jgi:hypothetical protein
MRYLRFLTAALALSLLVFAGLLATTSAPSLYAQSNISGDIAGTVTDASGAALPDAQVTVTSLEKGNAKTTITDKVGNFRVPLLAPGKYEVKATAKGFATATMTVGVSTGTITGANLALAVGKTSTTVEVNAGEIAVLHVDDAQISTSFDLNQLQNLPNPGGDVTFVAQTTPGATMNTQGGYGNFAVNGLPATSNTFTINGGYQGDPYLNLNNSGATNLLLGSNDVETATVTTNSFDASFGGLGGAQVNQVSRSGSNDWHGNVDYLWNGSSMNANSWFNKYYGSPKSFTNANQWAAAVGGPIIKNKLFGFIDNEGLHVIIPLIGAVYAPSQAWQNAILGPAGSAPENMAPHGNLADNNNSDEASMYQTIFDYYNKAPGYSGGYQDPNDPDMWIFQGHGSNLATEWLINGRVDYNVSQSDHAYIHFKIDKGLQPTQTSFIDPIFNAQSPQPSYEGQLSETHTFTPYLTNQFLFAASYYRAVFTNTNGRTLGATNVPFVLYPAGYASGGDWDIGPGGASDWVGGADYAFPQGRNVTGYQFGDDLTWVKGRNTWKFGYSFRRDDITDYTPSQRQMAYGGTINFVYDQGSFAAGWSDRWDERFPERLTQPIALYTEGFYVQDQYKPFPNLTITAGLRIEHDSNPVCQTNCVSNFAQNWNQLPTGMDTPYNQIFASGRHQGMFEEQMLGWQPRFGFSYLPFGPGSKTTIRGGFGLFNDYFPAQIMGSLISNVPTNNRFSVLGAAYVGAGGSYIAMDPTRGDSGHAVAVASNQALTDLYPQGGYYRKSTSPACPDPLSIYCATGGVFSRPAATGTERKIYLPAYDEWSFAVENQLMRNTVLAVQYVGNRSYHQPVSYLPNAYDSSGSIASLPTSRPNAALGTVTEYSSSSWSNYNGLQATLTSRLNWLTLQLNYTYGHALDTTSNGGFNAFGINANGQINPNNLQQNYGNADYDVRHYISANYSLRIPYWGGPRVMTDGWQFAGTIFHNTGYPFSVIDSTSAVAYGNAPLAKQIDKNFNNHCGGGEHATTSCSFASHFTNATDFGQQRRNQLVGPNFTDFDMDISKSFRLVPKYESVKLKVAAQFFNTFNHPNFQIPDFDVNSSGLGTITSTASTPTSVLGAFLGGDASPRMIQLKGTIVF